MYRDGGDLKVQTGKQEGRRKKKKGGKKKEKKEKEGGKEQSKEGKKKKRVGRKNTWAFGDKELRTQSQRISYWKLEVIDSMNSAKTA